MFACPTKSRFIIIVTIYYRLDFVPAIEVYSILPISLLRDELSQKLWVVLIMWAVMWTSHRILWIIWGGRCLVRYLDDLLVMKLHEGGDSGILNLQAGSLSRYPAYGLRS